jgi:hypothetical protein
MSPDADRHRDGANDTADVLGIAGTYPRPGWVVIDAIREHGFTGEVVCATTPAVTLHADRGRIYIAERASDAPLGERLVAAGALTPAELEQGVIRLAGAEHLGRLFERAPQVERDAVLAANDLMNDECLGWLAAQRIHGADVTPYRHHPSGMHRWEPLPDAAAPVAPAAPVFAAPPSGSPSVALPAPSTAPVALPAPLVASPTASPTASLTAPLPAPGGVMPPPPALPLAAPAMVRMPAMPPVPSSWGATLPTPAPAPDPAPAPASDSSDADDANDDVIRWDEPAFLDRPLAGEISLGLIKPLPTPGPRPVDPAHTPFEPADEPLLDTHFDRFDRFDRGETQGSSGRGSDPLAHATKMPPVPAEPTDRFEVIWPSGEVDEQFGGQPTGAMPHPDIDRAGPTARMVRDGVATTRSVTALKSVDLVEDAMADALGAGVDDIEVWLASETERDAQDEDVVLAVRRAVASIETGALGTRERRTGPRGMSLSTLDLQLDTGLVPPGRVAVRGETTGEIPLTATGRMSRPSPSAGSVFDEVPPALPASSSKTDADAVDLEPVERVSALRRLIGSLRRR